MNKDYREIEKWVFDGGSMTAPEIENLKQRIALSEDLKAHFKSVSALKEKLEREIFKEEVLKEATAIKIRKRWIPAAAASVLLFLGAVYFFLQKTETPGYAGVLIPFESGQGFGFAGRHSEDSLLVLLKIDPPNPASFEFYDTLKISLPQKPKNMRLKHSGGRNYSLHLDSAIIEITKH